MNTNKHEFRKPETLVNAWLGSFPNENTCLLVSSCREHISIATPAGQSRSAAECFTEYDKNPRASVQRFGFCRLLLRGLPRARRLIRYAKKSPLPAQTSDSHRVNQFSACAEK